MSAKDNDLFWLAITVIVLALGALAYLAHAGNVTAIVILAVLATLVFCGIGAVTVLVVMGKMDAMEQRRFRANVKENMVFMEMQQRATARQLQSQTRINRDLTYQNQQLARAQQEPGFGLDMDALFGDDDLVDLERDNGDGRWAAR